MSNSWVLAVVVASFLGAGFGVGCEDHVEAPAEGLAGAATMPDSSDAEALLDCEVEEPCAEAGIQLIENTSYNVRQEATACLLDALAQRRAGRYRYETDSTYSNGSTGARHVLLIGPEGGVLYVRTSYEGRTAGGGTTTVEAGQRCTLKPPEYFQACRAAIDAPRTTRSRSEDPVWACLFGMGDVTTPSRLAWFESCVDASPVACE